MSIDIFVNITRAGSPLANGTYCQLDNLRPEEAAYLGGESPYVKYEAYLLQRLSLLIGDLLTDTVNIDPKTGANVKYRIVSDPEAFPDSHMEMYVERVIGL